MKLKRGGGIIKLYSQNVKKHQERGLPLLKVNFMALKEDKRGTGPSPLESAKRS